MLQQNSIKEALIYNFKNEKMRNLNNKRGESRARNQQFRVQ